MEDRHPIDELFRDGLNNADIPFDERDWTALSRKIHPRRRRLPIIWIGSGLAAAVVIAAVLLFGGRETPVDHPTLRQASQQPAVVEPRIESSAPHEANQVPVAAVATPSVAVEPHGRTTTVDLQPANGITEPNPVLARVQGLAPITGAMPIANGNISPNVSVARTAAPSGMASTIADPDASRPAASTQHGWTLSIMAAPDLSGTRPLNGKLSGNIGLMATYRLTSRLGVSAGVLYARKLYQTDFANYRPSDGWSNPQRTPRFVDADCQVLDIPVNLHFDIAHRRRAAWFVSAGVSSYLMLRETYDYTYPPHEYGYPKQFTLHNQNRHILGIGNVAVGYRRQIGAATSITVQPFIKVPLTGIGNGNLKLYSSGIALSADVDLSRRRR